MPSRARRPPGIRARRRLAMIIAQITDIHALAPGARLPGGYDPAPAFAAVLARIASMQPRPDLIVFTGDLTDTGTAEEYAAFRTAIAGVDLPMLAIPGNHDDREALVEGLAGSPVETGSGRFLHLALDLGPLRLLGLDTVDAEDGTAGRLCAERLDWIEAELAASAERPTMIFMHHPPFRTGIGFMDAIRCAGGAAFADHVRRAPHVVGIACGHVHRAVTTRFGGTVATIAPAVCHAVPLDLAPDAPPRLEPQRPGFQIHLWEPELGLVSHAEYLAAAP